MRSSLLDIAKDSFYHDHDDGDDAIRFPSVGVMLIRLLI